MINENYNERHQAQTVGQIRDFMKKLNSLQAEHQSLRLHTAIAEKILNVTKEGAFHKRLEAEQSLILGSDAKDEYIEECIHRQEPLLKVLRILCLQSLTNNGLKSKMFDYFRREILHTYGFHHIFTLNNLEKLGLLKRNDTRSNFGQIRKSLKLWIDDIDENNPQDIAYVFSGYAPLSVRFLQMATRSGKEKDREADRPGITLFQGLKTNEELLRTLPGPVFEERQQLPAGVQDFSVAGTSASSAAADSQPKRRKIVLVYFIGGVTFAEISAIRFLSQLPQEDGQQFDYVIATTKLINGDSLLEPLLAAPAVDAA
eukprot:TRINITY_DN3139_c0_g1_i1.p1 TRINITY_DN3139_c0_g1~~TRINITY_DN3139_c0_g1_i1.p1  ORF type:complete len:315 (-),score=91.80 TRINITY_DN3139_c0_g1_i1:21-965(-)